MVYRDQGETEEPQRGGLTGPSAPRRPLRGSGYPQHHHGAPAGKSFCGATAKEDERLQALAYQVKGIILADPGRLLRYLRHRRHKFIAARVAL
jgi:hypothetical protein